MNTNLTVRDVVRYYVLWCSKKIRELKTENLMTVTGEGPDEKMIGRHISPMSPSWRVYQCLKRECSMWLTAVKILKVHPDFHDKPMERSTNADHVSMICHLTKTQRANCSRYFVEARRRIMRIQEQLINGSRHTTTRLVLVDDPKRKGASRVRQEETITYTAKSFETIERWKKDYEIQREANLKAKGEAQTVVEERLNA